jgi:hypothetical protein
MVFYTNNRQKKVDGQNSKVLCESKQTTLDYHPWALFWKVNQLKLGNPDVLGLHKMWTKKTYHRKVKDTVSLISTAFLQRK